MEIDGITMEINDGKDMEYSRLYYNIYIYTYIYIYIIPMYIYIYMNI